MLYDIENMQVEGGGGQESRTKTHPPRTDHSLIARDGNLPAVLPAKVG